MIDHIINDELFFDEDESLVTNFQKSDEHIYHRAIKLSGHSELYIADDATDVFGNRLPHLLALRTHGSESLTDFWDIYKQIKEATNAIHSR